jgi:hypothetical protein
MAPTYDFKLALKRVIEPTGGPGASPFFLTQVCRAGKLGLQAELSMADTPKLSVEKALAKLRKSDRPTSKNEVHDEHMRELDEEIKRMRAQRLRLEWDQRKRD